MSFDFSLRWCNRLLMYYLSFMSWCPTVPLTLKAGHCLLFPSIRFDSICFDSIRFDSVPFRSFQCSLFWLLIVDIWITTRGTCQGVSRHISAALSQRVSDEESVIIGIANYRSTNVASRIRHYEQVRALGIIKYFDILNRLGVTRESNREPNGRGSIL